MLLAFASLGAGMVSAEDCNEQTVNLEELGILEISMSDEGVLKPSSSRKPSLRS